MEVTKNGIIKKSKLRSKLNDHLLVCVEQ